MYADKLQSSIQVGGSGNIIYLVNVSEYHCSVISIKDNNIAVLQKHTRQIVIMCNIIWTRLQTGHVLNFLTVV